MTTKKPIKLNGIRNAKTGFSLIEIMISMGILGFTGLGVLTGLLQSRHMTESAIHENTALTIGQGYIEQIKNMEFGLLDEDILPTLFHEGTADTLMVSPLPADPEAGNAGTDKVNVKTVDINNTPDEDSDDMSMNIVVYVDDITDGANGIGDARRIILRYEYVFGNGSRQRDNKSVLYSIRSEVPTF